MYGAGAQCHSGSILRCEPACEDWIRTRGGSIEASLGYSRKGPESLIKPSRKSFPARNAHSGNSSLSKRSELSYVYFRKPFIQMYLCNVLRSWKDWHGDCNSPCERRSSKRAELQNLHSPPFPRSPLILNGLPIFLSIPNRASRRSHALLPLRYLSG